VLALDFDGVMCDALAECAAVTWHAGSGPHIADVPRVGRAVAEVPPAFLTTFASVRPYCRTLEDFMVTNAVPAGRKVDRVVFEQYRDQLGRARLAAQAEFGEQLRARWRTNEFQEWVALHTVYPGISELIHSSQQPVAIVSAKDAESIWAILEHHGLAEHVHTVVGSCTDKRPALTALPDRSGEPVTFVDDNLANAIAADALPRVQAWWATWGYHSPEDMAAAARQGIRTISLDRLAELQPLAAPSLPVRPERADTHQQLSKA